MNVLTFSVDGGKTWYSAEEIRVQVHTDIVADTMQLTLTHEGVIGDATVDGDKFTFSQMYDDLFA